MFHCMPNVIENKKTQKVCSPNSGHRGEQYGFSPSVTESLRHLVSCNIHCNIGQYWALSTNIRAILAVPGQLRDKADKDKPYLVRDIIISQYPYNNWRYHDLAIIHSVQALVLSAELPVATSQAAGLSRI